MKSGIAGAYHMMGNGKIGYISRTARGDERSPNLWEKDYCWASTRSYMTLMAFANSL